MSGKTKPGWFSGAASRKIGLLIAKHIRGNVKKFQKFSIGFCERQCLLFVVWWLGGVFEGNPIGLGLQLDYWIYKLCALLDFFCGDAPLV